MRHWRTTGNSDMAAKTGNSYISGTMTDRSTISTPNLEFFDHSQLEESDPGQLRQWPTTENGIKTFWAPILQFLVVDRCRNHLANLISSLSSSKNPEFGVGISTLSSIVPESQRRNYFRYWRPYRYVRFCDYRHCTPIPMKHRCKLHICHNFLFFNVGYWKYPAVIENDCRIIDNGNCIFSRWRTIPEVVIGHRLQHIAGCIKTLHYCFRTWQMDHAKRMSTTHSLWKSRWQTKPEVYIHSLRFRSPFIFRLSVVIGIALVHFLRVCHSRMPYFRRWNFDDICYSFGDISTSGNLPAILNF